MTISNCAHSFAALRVCIIYGGSYHRDGGRARSGSDALMSVSHTKNEEGPPFRRVYFVGVDTVLPGHR